MASYMLYVAEAEETPGLMASLGLETLVSPKEPSVNWMSVNKGPEGEKPGLFGFFLDPNIAGLGAYRPDRQTWRKAAGGRLWVGTDNERPLVPSDLRRLVAPEMTTPVLLDDGNEWDIPIAHYLPHTWGIGADGGFDRKPVDAFTDFCQQAELVDAQFRRHMAGEMLTLECQWDFVCMTLQLCYRLPPIIISTLGLIGDLSGSALLAATCERELIGAVEDQKKTLDLVNTHGTPPS